MQRQKVPRLCIDVFSERVTDRAGKARHSH